MHLARSDSWLDSYFIVTACDKACVLSVVVVGRFICYVFIVGMTLHFFTILNLPTRDNNIDTYLTSRI